MDSFPDVHLDNPELALAVWKIMHATEWRWPLDVALRQPDAMLQDVLKIEFAYRRIRDGK